MLILGLDASTYAGSVALIRDGEVVAETVVAMRGAHEERLMPALTTMLATRSVNVDQLDGVACGAGPGSFTSLRIAASIAKGLCTARAMPLYVAPSTLLVVASAEPALKAGRYLAALDAMRGDFFVQDVAIESTGVLRPGDASRMTRTALQGQAATLGATIVGPVESPPLSPHARGFGVLLRQGIATPVEMSTWEPDYGRKAEAQVRWEAAHGRELGAD